jgi:hypothetical protein
VSPVFECRAYRFDFEAIDAVSFSPGSAANSFRGAFGHLFRKAVCTPDCPGARQCPRRAECAYAAIFEPACLGGPSGFADAPRPFVIRAAELDAQRYSPSETFSIDVHFFDLRHVLLPHFTRTFQLLAQSGIGPGRGRIRLAGVSPLDTHGDRAPVDAPPVRICLEPEQDAPHAISIRFLTPTELKFGGVALQEAPFFALLARARDRISALSTLYGAGALELDFQGFASRAGQIEMVRSDLRWERHHRTSSRTGRAHPMEGFTGEAVYQGELGEFLPFLRAAYWTGIGRQTVWGKGVIRVAALC